uniref:Uncharacterized protein n=1 Tax=Panagrolaimus sp. PS1159 TaxID=55785 RepID=A0AC35FV05_9BILA
MLNILSKNVWLTDKLIIDYWIDKFCDVLIPKIVRFDIKELTINKCPNFPYKYFQILTKSKTLKSLKLYETQIFSSSDMNEMAFDEILASVENVNFISINPCNLLSKNIPGFKLINRKNKLKQIELFQIAQNPLISEIQEFFKNNVENGYLNKTDIIIEFQDISTSYLFKDSLPKKATPN